MKCCRRLLLLMLFLPLASPGAGDAPLDRATLRGLKAINVVLDPLDPDLQKAGLTTNDLLTRLEERLRSANIPVDTSSTEFAGLRMISVRSPGGRLSGGGEFAIVFELGVYQPVVLVRDKDIKTATPTWEVDTVLMTNQKQLHQAAKDTIDDLARRLASAWRSVNP